MCSSQSKPLCGRPTEGPPRMKQYAPYILIENLRLAQINSKKTIFHERTHLENNISTFSKSLFVIILMFIYFFSKWTKNALSNLYTHIQKIKMTYRPIVNFNNIFFLEVRISFMNKNYTLLSIYLKWRNLETYKNTYVQKQRLSTADTNSTGAGWIFAEKIWLYHFFFPIQDVISFSLRCDSGAGGNTYF